MSEILQSVFGKWKSRHAAAGARADQILDLRFGTRSQESIVEQSRRSIAPGSALTMASLAELVEPLRSVS